jgi:predicted RNA-binding protein YlqC (UPF0109 family)
MQELIAFMVRGLVENSGSVQVREVAGDKALVYEVRVAPEDRGKLIGKQGRTIRSVRSLAGAAASRRGKRVAVEVLD